MAFLKQKKIYSNNHEMSDEEIEEMISDAEKIFNECIDEVNVYGIDNYKHELIEEIWKDKDNILDIDNFDFSKYATPISKITNIDNEIANRISKEIFEKQLEEGDSDDPKWDAIYESILADYGLTLQK